MALSVTTTTGTIAPNNSRDFEVPVGSTLTLTFPPNSQATVTETPLFVGQTTTAGKLDQRITRIDSIPQTFTCGPYPTGANVTVAVSSRSTATVSWLQSGVGVVTATQLPGGGVTLDINLNKSQIINGGTAGATSGWLPISSAPERFVYQLDSGSTATTFSIDISADGETSLGQAFTGTWARSDLAEFTPPIMFTNPQARFFRFNVVTGGPLSVYRGA